MRVLRIVGSLVLGAIVSVILVSTVGCKPATPAVIRVYGANNFTYPLLEKGQVLTWEGPQGGPQYSIVWIGGSTPCKDKLPSIQSTNVSGVQTVTCEVETPPSAGHFYSYGIGPYSVPQNVIDGVQPCPGCTYYSGDSDLVAFGAKKVASRGLPGTVDVSCAGTATAGAISLNLADEPLLGTSMSWNSLQNVTINNVAFPNGSNIPCSNSTGTWKCDFSNPVGSSWTYTLTATGTAPPYCGPSTPGGTITTGKVTQ